MGFHPFSFIARLDDVCELEFCEIIESCGGKSYILAISVYFVFLERSRVKCAFIYIYFLGCTTVGNNIKKESQTLDSLILSIVYKFKHKSNYWALNMIIYNRISHLSF